MTEEELQQALDAMNGSALRAAAGLGTLSSAQLAAAQSSMAMANAQRALASAEEAGNIAARDSAANAVRNLQLQGAMGAAKAREAAAVKAAAAEEKAAADAVKASADQQAQAVQTLQHPIDAAAGALAKMGPEGQAAAAGLAVVGAISAATVGTLEKLAEKAIDVTERTAALRAGFAGLTGSAAGGKAVQDMIGNLNLPFATAQVNTWAASLVGAGVKGKNLEAELKAIAGAEALKAAFGGGGGAAAETFFKTMGNGGKEADEMLKKIQAGGRRGAEAIKAMGLNVEDFGGEAAIAKMNAQELTAAATKALQVKGAGPLEALGNTWDVIKMKAAAGFSSIFSGLAAAGGPVETFMQAVKSIAGEFSKGGVAVNFLRPIVTAVFTTLFSWATKALTAIHKGFLYVMIGALTAYIALRPVINAIKDIATSSNMLRGAAIIFGLMALPFVVMAAVMLVVVGIIGVVIGVVAALAAAFVYVVGAIASFVGSIASAFADAYSAATGAGGSVVDGLIAGVTAGAGAFVDALKGLASSGMAAFKSAFGIASPSKPMLEHGEKNIAGAAATGVDRGSVKVDAAMAKLGDGDVGSPTGSKYSARGGGERHYHFHYTGPGEDAAPFFEQAAAWLQGLSDEAPEPT